MKEKIRFGIFETNSSSTHSMTMCTKEDYNKWAKGEKILDKWEHKLVDVSPSNFKDKRLYTMKRYNEEIEYETFYEEFETPSGDKVVAFGYYGYDG